MSASPARSGYVSREHSCALGSRRGQLGALSLEQGEFRAWDELSFLRKCFRGCWSRSTCPNNYNSGASRSL